MIIKIGFNLLGLTSTLVNPGFGAEIGLDSRSDFIVRKEISGGRTGGGPPAGGNGRGAVGAAGVTGGVNGRGGGVDAEKDGGVADRGVIGIAGGAGGRTGTDGGAGGVKDGRGGKGGSAGGFGGPPAADPPVGGGIIGRLAGNSPGF